MNRRDFLRLFGLSTVVLPGCLSFGPPKIEHDPRADIPQPPEIPPQSFDVRDDENCLSSDLFFLPKAKTGAPKDGEKEDLFERENGEALVVGIIAPPHLVVVPEEEGAENPSKSKRKKFEVINKFFLFDNSYPLKAFLENPIAVGFAAIAYDIQTATKLAHEIRKNPPVKKQASEKNPSSPEEILLAEAQKDLKSLVEELKSISSFTRPEKILQRKTQKLLEEAEKEQQGAPSRPAPASPPSQEKKAEP